MASSSLSVNLGTGNVAVGGDSVGYTNQLIPRSNGRVNGVNITALNARTRTSSASAVDCVKTWTTRTSAANNSWRSVCWSSELSLFVAVAQSGTGNRVMTSPDGITWTARTSAADNQWMSVCWAPELSLFVAVAYSGEGNRVMMSPDGITWTARTSAANNQWNSVCWSSELSLFVAVATSGGMLRVMTSPDGITWTVRTSASSNNWILVCWSSELSLFVAVAWTGAGNRVMTSPDGIIWTARTSAADNQWISVCWSSELSLFVAVAQSGTGNRVMTSAIGMPNSKSVVKALPSQMTVLPNGNVGIGTTNPLAKMHAEGEIIVQGMPRSRNASRAGTFTSSSTGTFIFYINNWSWIVPLGYKRAYMTTFTFYPNLLDGGTFYSHIAHMVSAMKYNMISEVKIGQNDVTWAVVVTFTAEGGTGNRYLAISGLANNTTYTYNISGVSLVPELDPGL